MTPEQLAEIEARAAAATPGPWVSVATFDRHEFLIVRSMDQDDLAGSFGQEADADFAAAARSSVPVLCAALRECWTMLDVMRRDSDAYHRGRVEALREAANALRRMNFSRTAADVIESLAKEDAADG